jgi:hypothetical protein
MNNQDYVKSVEKNTRGLEHISIGPCPGCDVCRWQYGYEHQDDFDNDLENGVITTEPHFSMYECEICGDPLGGDRYEWHGVDKVTNEVLHFDSCCVDCLMYISNGDLPKEN